jgi:hypothetical protein
LNDLEGAVRWLDATEGEEPDGWMRKSGEHQQRVAQNEKPDRGWPGSSQSEKGAHLSNALSALHLARTGLRLTLTP